MGDNSQIPAPPSVEAEEKKHTWPLSRMPRLFSLAAHACRARPKFAVLQITRRILSLSLCSGGGSNLQAVAASERASEAVPPDRRTRRHSAPPDRG